MGLITELASVYKQYKHKKRKRKIKKHRKRRMVYDYLQKLSKNAELFAKEFGD